MKTKLHHVNGTPWWEVPMPRRWHLCRPHTMGFTDDGTPVFACPCGGIRIGLAGRWQDRNSRGKEARRG